MTTDRNDLRAGPAPKLPPDFERVDPEQFKREYLNEPTDDLVALDRWCAEKVMGWRTVTGNNYRDADGHVMHNKVSWHPTTDANQALVVLEKWLHCDVRRQGIVFALHDEDGVLEYEVQARDQDGDGFVGLASTLPLAICKVVRAAIGGSG